MIYNRGVSRRTVVETSRDIFAGAKRGFMRQRRHDRAASTRGWYLTVAMLALVSCSPGEPERALQYFDLCVDLPRVESRDGSPALAVAQTDAVPLGPANLGNLDGDQSDGARAPSRPGLAAALVQPVDFRLVFPLMLGQPAFFEFRPLRANGEDGALRHRVSIRANGTESAIWEHKGSYSLWPPPEKVSLDLERFSGQEVELVLDLVGDGAGEREFYWVSPQIISGRVQATLPAPESQASRLNVLLIGVDTVRADALGAYGASPSWTPALDRFADSSDVWLEAYSTFNVTGPSFSSILTGLYGKNHGVYENRGRLSDDAETLAEILKHQGYSTAAFLAARHLFSGNLGQGFSFLPEPKGHLAGEAPVNAAMAWLRTSHEPFFAWVHLYDAHTPHTPPGRFARGERPASPSGVLPVVRWIPSDRPPHRPAMEDGLFADSELYRGEVAYLDRQVDRLLGFLEERGLLERTIVIFLSDHGELIDEHGESFRHVGFWEEVVRVPLIIRWPKSASGGRRLSGLVQTIDVLPSVLRSLSIAIPPVDGRPLLVPGEEARRRAVFAEHSNGIGAMIRTASHKHFYTRFNYAFPAGDYLYDVGNDLAEANNTATSQPDIIARLRATLAAWQKTTTGIVPREQQQLSAKELEELRALGYLD